MAYLGTTYAWGGGDYSGPSQGIRDGGVADRFGDYNKVGFDCSGLALYAWAQVGVYLPHYSGYQYSGQPHVSRSDLQPGDLVFFAYNTSDPSTIHHVAIWIGNNQIIEAPNSGSYVKISTMYWNGFIGRRPRRAGDAAPRDDPVTGPAAAIVLAGGRGRRLGDVDKPAAGRPPRPDLAGHRARRRSGAPVIVVGPAAEPCRRASSASGRTRPEAARPPRSPRVSAALVRFAGRAPTRSQFCAARSASGSPRSPSQSIAATALASADPAIARIGRGGACWTRAGRRQYLIGVWRCGALPRRRAAAAELARRGAEGSARADHRSSSRRRRP